MNNKKVNAIFVLSNKNVSGIGHSDLFNPKFSATYSKRKPVYNNKVKMDVRLFILFSRPFENYW